ncbi:hypothetical protein SAY87_007831 [Trapa incisa]|uniref:Uncharacterized protein n=1 Tax=Trapa incisa TaxID=236973 RepID=A0AAN7QFQ4_9MYRT|nr:hypothetical protein SAY87_007831 [Trapa incisa]
MADQRRMRVALILTMVVAMALAGSGEARKCMDECMPVCMKIDRATHEKCVHACEGYCNQIEGSSKGGCHQWACN